MIKNIHDISVLINRESIDYPGDPKFETENIASIKNGDGFNLSKISMSSHSGTHMDFPLHFFDNGKSSSDYQAKELIFDTQVITVSGQKRIKAADICNIEISENSAVLFKTDNSISGRAISGQYRSDYVCLDESAAKYLQEKHVKLVGIDYNSIDESGSKDFSSHHLLLGNGILILEGINLYNVKDGNYLLLALSLNIPDSEASPVRAILLEIE